MNIFEEKIDDLDNEPPKFKKNSYPVPYHSRVQRPYFIACAVGARGSGKTYSIVKMLSNQEKSGLYDPDTGDKVDIRHILFSPTLEGNPIFKSLKYLDDEDCINEYTDKKLLDCLDEIKAYNDEVKEYKQYKQAYIKYSKMSDEQLKKTKDYDMIATLMAHNFIHYSKLEEKRQRVVNIILDDCLASKEAFSNKRGSTLVKAVLNSRHMGVNIIIAAQNLKSITKAIRNNVDVWILFRFKNDKLILNDLWPEVSGTVSESDFLSLYHYCTQNDNDALVYDGKEPDKRDRFKLNFDVILRY